MNMQSEDNAIQRIDLMFYPSMLAFLIMSPLWFLEEGIYFIMGTIPTPKASIIFLFFINGIFQFAQNFLAFSILESVSPVTYSIASLFKRVFVICGSIAYAGDHVSFAQGIGISVTFFGLYLYNSSRKEIKSKERLINEIQHHELPFTYKQG